MPHEERVHLDRALLYLFSFDVEVDLDRDNIGFVAGGVRVNIRARAGLSRVYQVLHDRTVGGIGAAAITGTVVWGGDNVYWREDDIEFSNVRLALQTDDGAIIEGHYPVVMYLQPGGFRRLVSKKGKLGDENAPLEVSVITTPRFSTASPTYRWINDLQCVGFGRVSVVRSEFRRITYDIYGMT